VVESDPKIRNSLLFPWWSYASTQGVVNLTNWSNGFEARLILITKAKLGYTDHVENERYNVKILVPNNDFSIQI